MDHARFQFLWRGKGDPYIHLKTYIREFGAYAEDEKLKIQLFLKSLTGSAKTWYARLDSSKFQSWEDLANAFMNQYSFHSQVIPERFQLMRLKKKPNESSQVMLVDGGIWQLKVSLHWTMTK